ncbi:MAG TPA: CrcB family protein [Acidimicrobiales bacterium]
MDHDAAGAPVAPAAARRARRTAAGPHSGRRGRASGGRPGGGRAAPGVLAAVAVGGMIGASARYGLARAIPARPGGVPWATLGANLAGSFLLGLVLVVVLERFPPTRHLRPFLATGVLGAFTTMSTFQVEIALLIRDGHATTGLAYGLGSLAAGLGLAYAGVVAGRLVPLRHPEAPR